MRRTLERWWGWLLVILIFRAIFILFEQPSISPQQQTTTRLLELALQEKQPEQAALAREGLENLLLYYSEERERVENILQARIKQDVAVAAKLWQQLQKNPVFALEKIFAQRQQSILRYLSPLAFLLSPVVMIGVAILLPAFLLAFIGRRAIRKFYGRSTRWLLWLGNVGLLASWTSFLWHQGQIPLYLHSLTIAFVLYLLWQLWRGNFFVVFLGEYYQSQVRQLFLVLVLLLTASIYPHFLPQRQQEQADEQQKIQNVLNQITAKHYQACLPYLLEILNHHPDFTALTVKKTLSVLQQYGKSPLLPVIYPLLESPRSQIRAATIKTISAIVARQAQEESHE